MVAEKYTNHFGLPGCGCIHFTQRFDCCRAVVRKHLAAFSSKPISEKPYWGTAWLSRDQFYSRPAWTRSAKQDRLWRIEAGTSVYGLLLIASNLLMTDMARLHTYIRPLELAYVDAGP